MTITTTDRAADTSGELFTASYARVELETTVEADGYIFTVTFRDTPLDAAIATLKRRGCTPVAASAPAPATNGNGAKKPAAPRVAPRYDGSGQACCPTHNRPLKEGKFGPYCSAKDADDTYCNLKFLDVE